MSSRIKNILAAIAIIAILIGVANMAVPYIVNPTKVRAKLQEDISRNYGLILKSEEKAFVKTFPSPEMYFKNVSVSDASGKELITAPSVILDIGWWGIISGNATRIELIQAKASAPKTKLAGIVAHLTHSEKSASLLPPLIQFTNASLDITNNTESEVKSSTQFRQINATLTSPKESVPAGFTVDLQYNGKPLSIRGNYDSKNGNEADLDIKLNDKAHILLNGAFSSMETLAWAGKVTGNISDLTSTVDFFGNTLVKMTESSNVTKPENKFIGLQFEGSATADEDGISLGRTEATLNSQKAAISAYVGWQDAPTIAVELTTESADLDKWYKTFAPGLMANTVKQPSGVAPLVTQPLGNTSLYLLLNIENATYNTKEFKKFSLDAELSDGKVVVHHAEAFMAGDTKILIDGIVNQQPEGQRFSGVASVEGKHFNEWLAIIEPSAKNLPSEDFADFSIGGNLFISEQQLRLSEAKLRIHEFELLGGVATYFDAKPRVEAEIKLQQANLDYFRDAWRKQISANQPSYQLLIGDVMKYDWLRKLPAIFDFTIAIQGFQFMDSQGDFATMRLYMTPAELNLYSIDLRFPDNTINGNIKFNVSGPRPRLDLAVSATRFNTSYVMATDQTGYAPYYDPTIKDKRFSEELFDLRWMNALDAGFDITLAELIHRDTVYANFKWKAELQNAAMNIQKLGFAYLNGTFDITGTLVGGKVPSLSASFALYNINMPEFIKRYFNSEQVQAGNISITGAVATSGIHMRSWLEQAELKLTASARGVRVKDLNLQGVIDITSQARSTTDVSEGVKTRIFEGTTELAIDGSINMLQGVMKTPGIRLVYGSVLGNLTGEVQLQPWTLNLSTLWQFPEISSSTVPTMNTNQQGNIDAYTTRIDTSSLEAFVAKRIVGQ